MKTMQDRSRVVVTVAAVIMSLSVGAQRATAQVLGPIDLGVLACGAPNNSGTITCGSTNWLTGETRAFVWTQATGLTDLGTLGGTSSSAVALNDVGMVVGSSSLATGEPHAFVWTPATGMTDLGTLGGTSSSAVALNNTGMVVGSSSRADGDTHAFVWTPATGMTDLGTLGGTSSSAVALNDTGMVVGSSSLAAGAGATPKTHAFAWTQASGMIDLGSIGDTDSQAQAVNNGGMVLGIAAPFAFPGRHGFVWTPTTGMIDLTFVGDNDSVVIGQNDAGMVVGQSSQLIFTGSGILSTQRGFAWTQTTGMIDIGTLGYSGSYPHTYVGAVNKNGMVVGYSPTATGLSHAFAWTQASGRMTDLGSLGGTSFAPAVNDNGLVIGFSAPVDGVFQFRGFAWTQATGMVDLGTLDGSSDTRAWSVNNSGLVVGSSRLPDFQDHAVWWNVSLGDRTPPTLSLPTSITVNATSPSGAVVTFAATASDPDDTAGPVTCLPASGSLFAIGTTTVTCSATDTHGNSASGDFAVAVLSPTQIISNLITTVAANDFQQAENLLQNALRSLDGGTSAPLPLSACDQLLSFINQVRAQAGKALLAPTATQLIQSAADARAALACP